MLGNDVAVFSFEKTDSIRTNYSNIKYYAANQSIQQILNENSREYFYVFWDADRVPAICAPFEKIYNNLDYVTAVGFDTYVISINYRIAIVFDHNNKIKIQNQFYDY